MKSEAEGYSAYDSVAIWYSENLIVKVAEQALWLKMFGV